MCILQNRRFKNFLFWAPRCPYQAHKKEFFNLPCWHRQNRYTIWRLHSTGEIKRCLLHVPVSKLDGRKQSYGGCFHINSEPLLSALTSLFCTITMLAINSRNNILSKSSALLLTGTFFKLSAHESAFKTKTTISPSPAAADARPGRRRRI